MSAFVDFLKTKKTWIAERLKERSTWLGFVALFTAVGVSINPELQEALVTLGVSIGAVIGIFTADVK